MSEKIQPRGLVFKIETEPYKCLWLHRNLSLLQETEWDWVEGMKNAYEFPTYELAVEAAKKYPGSHASVAEGPPKQNSLIPISDREKALEAKRREDLEKHQAILRRMHID